MSVPGWYHDWLESGIGLNALDVFFIVGCQKSGTTWLQRHLDGHPHVCCRGEAHVADHLAAVLRATGNAYNARQAGRADLGLSVQLEELDMLGVLKMLSDTLLAKYLAGCAEPRAIRAVGDKTPEHATGLALLNRLYPQGRFIHIIRDGRDGAVSGWAHLQRQGKAGSFRTFADYAAYFAEHHWCPYIAEARRAAAGFPDRYLEVRYERFHAQPEQETLRLLRHLGLDDGDNAVAACVAAGSFEKLSGGRRPGEEDPSSFFRKGAVGDWRRHFDDEARHRFEASAGALLRELGYEPATTVVAAQA